MERPAAGIPESFARYLARVLVQSKGYKFGAPPEAAELVQASDLVLTRLGLSPLLACIVDAESDPSRRFQLDPERVLAIAQACRERYSGTVNGVKMPAVVEVIEVRAEASTDDWERLRPIRKRIGTAVSAFLIDLGAAKVRSNNPALIDLRRRFFQRLLREPRRAPEEQPARALPQGGFAWLTVGILALLAAVFAAELLVTGSVPSWLTPDVETLVAMGGLNRKLVVESGEWYRLFTATLLHANPLHLIFNGIALWMAGAVLEPLFGRWRLIALYVLGALGGSLASIQLNDPSTVSVGASGAIMCLLAAALVATFRLPSGGTRDVMQVQLARVLIPSLLPLAAVRTSGKVDFGAHLGGALVGLCAGALTLASWPRADPRPRFLGAAVAVALAGLGAIGWGGFQVRERYGRYAVSGQLIPKEQMPKPEDAAAQSASLLARYPRDPRARAFRAAAYLSERDGKSAEAQVRAAFAEPEILHTHFNQGLDLYLHSLLAQSLLQQERQAEALEAAKPVCAGPDSSSRQRLRALKLCEP